MNLILGEKMFNSLKDEFLNSGIYSKILRIMVLIILVIISTKTTLLTLLVIAFIELLIYILKLIQSDKLIDEILIVFFEVMQFLFINILILRSSIELLGLIYNFVNHADLSNLLKFILFFIFMGTFYFILIYVTSLFSWLRSDILIKFKSELTNLFSIFISGYLLYDKYLTHAEEIEEFNTEINNTINYTDSNTQILILVDKISNFNSTNAIYDLSYEVMVFLSLTLFVFIVNFEMKRRSLKKKD